MKRVHLLIGSVAALSLAGCAGTRDRKSDPPREKEPGEMFPVKSASVKAEVDRQFDQEHPGALRRLGVWGTDRWFDLLDILAWDLSVGRGFGVNAHITEFAQIGLNWWDGTSWGQRGRAFGVWETDEEDRGLGPFYWVELERTPTWGTQSLFKHEYKYTGWDLHEAPNDKATHNDWSAVGATLHVFALGAHVDASPIEIVDFVAGLFPVGLVANVAGSHHPIFDIMGDDAYSELEKELRTEKGLGQ